jgi:hypothetical protein
MKLKIRKFNKSGNISSLTILKADFVITNFYLLILLLEHFKDVLPIHMNYQ